MKIDGTKDKSAVLLKPDDTTLYGSTIMSKHTCILFRKTDLLCIFPVKWQWCCASAIIFGDV